jgi:alkanesulfonate monooxygenase SsuD/methylene tetrahydromethanopterin reductase-like flavin-dependent oxidoreductase (luciferase family)
MKFGFVLPRGDARTAADFARHAELSGWDGFFVWEPVWGIDAWVALTAAAMLTERIRLGTMLSPVSRMRPWKLASESATLDNLSNGRVIISVGLGALDSGFKAFGEETNRKIRAELMDEGLEILTALWRGMPVHYQGKHYRVDLSKKTIHTPLPPPPVQQPRIPIWVVGAWPRKRSMQRAMRYDGLLPNMMGEDGKVRMSPATPEEIREMKAFIDARRKQTTAFDIVIEGETSGGEPERATEIVGPYADAGATWWIEALWSQPDQGRVLERLKQGPPQLN